MRAALREWGDVTVVGPLAGGHRNQVWEVRRGGERLVARQSGRGPASLDWEADVLGHLARHGFRVPSVVPALDGRRQVGGVVVQSWLAGEKPGPADWPAVAATLRRLHEVTAGWPQRPGLPGPRELLHVDRGGDVDLTAMPPAVAVACRRAWARLDGVSEAVVHGDPGHQTSGLPATGWACSTGTRPGWTGSTLTSPTCRSARYRLRGCWPPAMLSRPGRSPPAGLWNPSMLAAACACSARCSRSDPAAWALFAAVAGDTGPCLTRRKTPSRPRACPTA